MMIENDDMLVVEALAQVRHEIALMRREVEHLRDEIYYSRVLVERMKGDLERSLREIRAQYSGAI